MQNKRFTLFDLGLPSQVFSNDKRYLHDSRTNLASPFKDKTKPMDFKCLYDMNAESEIMGLGIEIDSYFIPGQIFLIIAKYLDMKSLVKLSSLCRRWNAFLSGKIWFYILAPRVYIQNVNMNSVDRFRRFCFESFRRANVPKLPYMTYRDVIRIGILYYKSLIKKKKSEEVDHDTIFFRDHTYGYADHIRQLRIKRLPKLNIIDIDDDEMIFYRQGMKDLSVYYRKDIWESEEDEEEEEETVDE